jgi:hypothetical protein
MVTARMGVAAIMDQVAALHRRAAKSMRRLRHPVAKSMLLRLRHRVVSMAEVMAAMPVVMAEVITVTRCRNGPCSEQGVMMVAAPDR